MDAITVNCTSCKHTMRFGAEKAGRRAKCPKCGAVVTIAASTETAVKAAQAPAPPPEEEEEGLGVFGVSDVMTEEEVQRRRDAEEADAKKKKKKKPGAKLTRRVKALADGEQWEKVRAGLLFVFIGTCLWAAAHLLQGLYVALGAVDYTEYTRLLVGQLNERAVPMPADGGFWDVNTLNMLLGMISGIGFLGLAKACIVLAMILRFSQAIVSCVGYVLCLAVPTRFGTTVQAWTLLGLGTWNVLAVLLFMLLPVVGAYTFYLVPLLTPEIVMTEYNMERSLPLNVMWMGNPFWEMVLTLFVLLLYHLEPIVGGAFVWSIGLSIKEDRLAEAGQGLVQLGLGQFFILVSFQMLSVTGSTPVAVLVLRVLYGLWFGFLLLFLLNYASVLLKTRTLLYEKLNPANELEED